MNDLGYLRFQQAIKTRVMNYETPCDGCPFFNDCKRNQKACDLFSEWVETGSWTDPRDNRSNEKFLEIEAMDIDETLEDEIELMLEMWVREYATDSNPSPLHPLEAMRQSAPPVGHRNPNKRITAGGTETRRQAIHRMRETPENVERMNKLMTLVKLKNLKWYWALFFKQISDTPDRAFCHKTKATRRTYFNNVQAAMNYLVDLYKKEFGRATAAA